MTELIVDAVYPKRSIYPMVVNFQNAYITDEFRDTECSLYNNEENDKKTVLALLDDIIYTGEDGDESLGRMLLVARDRTTGKVRIIEPGHVDLKPVIKSDMNSSQLLEPSGLELSRKFGSKKQKRQLEQREKLKMNVELVTQQVEKTTEKVSIDQLDISSYDNISMSDDFYIPPINRGATCVENIYDIHKIISEEDIDKITSEIGDKDINEELLPCIKPIVDANPTRIHKIFGLYASCLAKFFKLTIRILNQKNSCICNSSHTLNNIIMKNFTTLLKNKRGRPGEYKDKAFCHTVVLFLLINNYKVSIEKLCEAFGIAPRTVMAKARVIGASIIQQGGKQVLHLKLPLQVKAMQRKRRM